MTFEVAMVAVVGLLVLGYNVAKAIEHIWPSEPLVLDPVDVIDNELRRLHSEMKDYVGGTHASEGYKAVVAEVARLNQALIDLEMENTKAFNTVQINQSVSSHSLQQSREL